MFEMMNTRNDGQLTESQLLGLTSRLAVAFGRTAESRKTERLNEALRVIWDRHLRHMDYDGNGQIDPEEYERGIREAGAGDREAFLSAITEMVAAWLDICDVDGNGGIDVDEYAQMYGSTFGTPRAQLEEAFRQLDLDGNGVLDPDEIQAAVREFFTSEDPEAPGNHLFGPL